MENSTFGDKLKRAIVEAGVTVPEPTSDRSVPEGWILDLPEQLLINTRSTLTKLAKSGGVLPIFHITPGKVLNNDGTTTSTRFVDSIREKGLLRNTNCTAFIFRDLAGIKEPKLATVDELRDHPDHFINDILLILRNYYHHGTRVRRDQLKTFSRATMGIPVLTLFNSDGLRMHRGGDGIEHYVTSQSVSPDHFLGSLDLEGLGSDNLEDKYRIVQQILDLINSQFV